MKKNNRSYGLIIFSFVLLFNPTSSLIDILPDFIAWFILARLIERAADSAAYFEEARSAFIKLGWLNIAKIPGFLLAFMIRSGNAMDNDVIVLFSFAFAVCELLLIIPAIKNIFLALFHLGERTPLQELITPFKTHPSKTRSVSPEALREYTFFFAICKCILSTLPDMLLLSRTTDVGGATHLITGSKFYPFAILGAQIIGFIIGTVWLIRAIAYAKAINHSSIDDRAKSAGNSFGFSDALNMLALEDTAAKFEKKVMMRKIFSAFTVLTIGAFFSIDIAVDNFDSINLIPQFLFAAVTLIGIFMLGKHVDKRVLPAKICAFTYMAASVVSYVFSASFLMKYDYLDLLSDKAALSAYIPVQITATVEFIAAIGLFVSLAFLLREFVLSHTGLSRNSDRYSRTEKEYHNKLIGKSFLLSGFGIAAVASKFTSVFLNRDVEIHYAFVDDFDYRPIVSSSAPWFGVVVVLTSIIFIGYSFYFYSTLKDEVKMKYTLD